MTPQPAQRHALVYGDVNLNLVDGSAVWVQSAVQALVRAGLRVTLVLKARVQTRRLLGPVEALPAVTVVRPLEDGGYAVPPGDALRAADAAQVLAEVDERDRADLLLLRGRLVAQHVAAGGRFDGRLWTYLTDIPQQVADVTTAAAEELAGIARSSRWLLCQTEELRGFLETVVPEAAGRCVTYPPVVPEPGGTAAALAPSPGEPVALVYTGKFAPRWRTLEMTRLPVLLGSRGIDAVVHMVGDKIHDDATDPAFSGAMRRALESAPGVIWHGGVPRDEAMRIAAGCAVGLCWRHPGLDASLELSTKLLEFGLLGLPAVVNRTPMHEELLGADYPLFVATEGDVIDAVARVHNDAALWALAAQRCRSAADRHRLGAAADRLRRLLGRTFPPAPEALQATGRRLGRALRVGVAGHDLKFFTEILQHIRSLSGVEVRVDAWPALGTNEPARTREVLDWADVVVVEWCGPAAVHYSRHYSQHRRPGQRLIVRLHRFELSSPYPGQVAIDGVDRVVCVSPHYAQLTAAATGWPEEKIVVVPNWVDVEQLDRPKLPGAQHHLGFLGIAPMRKRFDRALTVLEELRRRDSRYRLFAKTKMPWDYWWIWKSPAERSHMGEVLRRVATSELLRGAVVFDSFGPDVARWLRTVGFVLSTSDDESFHLAPAEGMASGAVPALLGWPGADGIYDRQWIGDSPAALADSIADLVAGGRWDAVRREAQAQARAAFDLPLVADRWAGLLLADVP